jgi:chemotaxis protein CheD
MVRRRRSTDVFLGPGEYHVASAGVRIRTVLGSCVSITLWSAARRIGAMSHFLLSERVAGGPAELDGRYAEEATALMLRDLAREGVTPQQCQAKLFGGGNMFPQHVSPSAGNIGHRNGEAARALMIQHSIPIVSESLFGVGYREVIFDIATGDVWLRQVRPSDPVASAAVKRLE